ncbi:penicillin-binding protein 2 [Mucilaginibacter mallensis]|uniref:Penicillin-binding protein 2 n=1 Tax=Mucilaginibacter mallensis TaxID=652787 RepID=A0A1H1QNE9_MUCMA|nr:penicillin-binding protein 2 [Mucilaginibacter mallensis]SDS24968.1 penicillin-binding protein 2 [Mucilaginibacter mallensis]
MNTFFVRRYVIAGIFITIILILLAKLFYIQIIDKQYSIYATKNVLRQIKIYPARGPILDRNNKVLVQNQAFYDIMVTPKQVKPFDTLEFCKLLDITKDDFDVAFEKAKKYYPNQASPLVKQLTVEKYASIQERLSEFPGFEAITRYLRFYPDSVAAQFLGYIGEVNDDQIKRSHGNYHQGDYIGITGVEKSYEDVLRGQVGIKNMVYDSHNRPKGSYMNGALDTPAVAGERLTSSLDMTIQKLGEQLMQNKVGSIIAIEPSTGEILCFVSSPTYDPNLMVGRERGNNAAKMYKDPYTPFLIRPIQAYYPPGSSFKPLNALIALQAGLITPETSYYCTGAYKGGLPRCDEPHGQSDLARAIAVSCNTYFSSVFERLMNVNGAKNIDTTFVDWRKKVSRFSFGERLDIDLPNEGRGFLPTAQLYNKKFGVNHWRSNSILSLAIGQGELEATPLQMANIECTIANHGFYYRPHLIKAIGDRKITKAEYTQRNYVGIDAQYFEPVINGMQQVVESGTAHNSQIPGIVMCGKTGTAQNPHGKNHSIFVAFAPRENPKIAIAVVVENAGQGAWYAAPIASYIVEKYLTDTIKRSMSDFNRIKDANLMPDPTFYYSQIRKEAARDSIRKAKADSIRKRGTIKSVATKKRNDNRIAVLTSAIKGKENE